MMQILKREDVGGYKNYFSGVRKKHKYTYWYILNHIDSNPNKKTVKHVKIGRTKKTKYTQCG